MTTDNDSDQSIKQKTNRHLSQEPVVLVKSTGTSLFQNELSMEIVKLVHAHLQKAQIEGIISAETSDRVLHSYITNLKQLEHRNRQKQLQERLQTLERMQEQIVNAYHERLGQLTTEIQQFRSITTPNELAVHRNKIHIPQTPRPVPETQPAWVQDTVTQQPKRNRHRNKPRITFSSFSKYTFPVVIISALTVIGIRFGMTIFMAAGSLMIVGALFIRFIKK